MHRTSLHLSRITFHATREQAKRANMANEIQHASISGRIFYIQIENSAGQVWNGSSFQTYSSANWGTYAVALSERAGTGKYYANMPALAAGRYAITPFLQAGAAPAIGDYPDQTYYLDWNGSAPASVAALSSKDVSAQLTEIRIA